MVQCLAEASCPISTCRLAAEVVCLKLQSVSQLAMVSQVFTSYGDDFRKKRYAAIGKLLHQFCAENHFFLLRLAVRIELFPCADKLPLTRDQSKHISFHLHFLTNVLILPFPPFLLTALQHFISYSVIFVPVPSLLSGDRAFKLFQYFSSCSMWTTGSSQMPENGMRC